MRESIYAHVMNCRDMSPTITPPEFATKANDIPFLRSNIIDSKNLAGILGLQQRDSILRYHDPPFAGRALRR